MVVIRLVIERTLEMIDKIKTMKESLPIVDCDDVLLVSMERRNINTNCKITFVKQIKKKKNI